MGAAGLVAPWGWWHHEAHGMTRLVEPRGWWHHRVHGTVGLVAPRGWWHCGAGGRAVPWPGANTCAGSVFGFGGKVCPRLLNASASG